MKNNATCLTTACEVIGRAWHSVILTNLPCSLLPSGNHKFEAKPEADNFEGCDAIFSFDASDFVLTAFQRFPGGAARGDYEVINKVRNLFFTI